MSAVREGEAGETDALALTLLVVASILSSAELSDAEARLAALSAIGRETARA